MDKGIEALISKVKKQTESFDTVVLKEDEAKALIAALEQVQRNAMRYQFIRDKDAFGDESEPGLIGWDGLVELDANEFDAAIDERMAHPNIAYAPPHHNGMMQLSNELAEMKRIGKWVARSEHMPDPNDKRRICVYTPDVSEDLRYRFVPASLFKAVCSDATHWHYMEPPTEGGEWDGES